MTVSTALDHRIGAAAVRLTDATGTALADAAVEVEQVRHAFGFGNIGFDLIDLAADGAAPGASAFAGASQTRPELLADLWLDVFNHATLPFYWRQFEPTPGAPDTARLQAAARWFHARGVTVKGHPLLWHTLAPQWLMGLGDAAVEARIRERIVRETRDFAGLVDMWDAINEAVILPVFTAEDNAVTRLAHSRGQVEMVRLAFESAREGDPSVRLVLNDFDLSPDYEDLIERCLDAGIAIDAIGLQTHMHQGFRGEDELHGILERFARFGLPLQLTETTLVSGELMPAHIVDLNDYQVDHWPSIPEGEARQADELERHYRLAFSHPAVESLTYWGLTDDGAWLGAPAGLVRLDGTPKPAYDMLRALVRDQWWTAPTTLRTDRDGVLQLEGFAGEYRIGLATQPARSATVTLDRGGTARLSAVLE